MMNSFKGKQKKLAEVRAEINANEANVSYLRQQERELVNEISLLSALDSPMMSATNYWCRITNALIAKYKSMSEREPEKALQELIRIEGALLAGGFLTRTDLDQAL